jgi:hypothetical protein
MGFTAWHALVKSDWFIWFLLLVVMAVAWAYPFFQQVLRELYFEDGRDRTQP